MHDYTIHTKMEHFLKILQEQIHLRHDKPALCDYQGRQRTYGELAAEIEQYHIFFRSAGIKEGDKVAIVARNSARWGVFFLSLNTYGAVAVPILPNFTPEGTAQLVNHSDSICLIIDNDLWKSLRKIGLPNIHIVLDAVEERLLYYEDETVKSAWENRGNLFSEKYPDGFNPTAVIYHEKMDSVGIINYTSGTSGDPKGVMLSFGAMSDIVEYCRKTIGENPDTIVSMLPMAHIYGLIMEFLYPCCTGYTIHFLGKVPSPSLLMESMQELKPSLIITVPLVMEKLYNTLIKPAVNTRQAKAMRTIPGLRTSFYKSLGKKVLSALGGRVQTIIIGGAPLNWKVESAFRKIGLPYAVGYGMTEACPLLALEMPDKFVSGSCGKPVHVIRIDSSDPERIPGEIQAKGPNICIGYYKNPAADEAAHTADGWFRTGDLGVMDEDSNLFIRGRIKALILSASGQNIYPEEVEQVLSRHGAVEEALVLERTGKVTALVYPRPHAVAGADDQELERLAVDIRDKTNQYLPKFSQIFRVEIVDSPFERTAKGTMKRYLYV